jgi:hypothetical protein
MFGLTKKQFLKKSASCLDEAGNHALLIRELIDHETDETIHKVEAYNQIKRIIEGIESTFFRYEELNPPSQCVSLQLKILNCLIVLQEATATNYDFITASIEGKDGSNKEKLKSSKILLEKFRKAFRPLTKEVDSYLKPYKKSQLKKDRKKN